MIRFYNPGILGAINSPHYFVTREVLIQQEVRNWFQARAITHPEENQQNWAKIQAQANKERAVSNDISVDKLELSGKKLALIAGTKIGANSPTSGKILGEFKFMVVEEDRIMDALREQLGIRAPQRMTWEQLKQAKRIERR